MQRQLIECVPNISEGRDRAKIDAIADWRNSPLFSDEERAVLQLAEEVTRGPGASPECLAALAPHFDHAGIVELTLTASFYVCVGRFLVSMRLELEPDYRQYALPAGSAG